MTTDCNKSKHIQITNLSTALWESCAHKQHKKQTFKIGCPLVEPEPFVMVPPSRSLWYLCTNQQKNHLSNLGYTLPILTHIPPTFKESKQILWQPWLVNQHNYLHSLLLGLNLSSLTSLTYVNLQGPTESSAQNTIAVPIAPSGLCHACNLC